MSKFVYNKISPAQHGFIQKRSTVSNLVDFYTYVARALGSGGAQVDIVYTDIHRAFDQVSHDVLLGKLAQFGFSRDLVKFFASYLRRREQKVFFGGALSEPYFPSSSVVQGSKLSGLLFAVLIDGIGECIRHSNYLLYADDFKLFRVISNEYDSRLLQEDLRAVNAWLKEIQLEFSINKCDVMTITTKRSRSIYEYTINDSAICRVDSKKDLGVIFQTKLKFDQHIAEIAKKAYKTLGLVVRHSYFFSSIDTIKLLFTSLVRSKLEYASVIWAPQAKSHVLMLEKIQARFIRSLFRRENGFYPAYPNAISYGLLRENLVMESLESRREYNYLMLLYNILNNYIDIPSVLQHISVRVPIIGLRVRENAPFFCPGDMRSPVYDSSSLPIAMAIFNKHSSALDIADNINNFKEKSKCLLYT
ncbi:hypothetical protein WDU94_013897 [Cyamophila willieti]